jgi:rare lipoprotein A
VPWACLFAAILAGCLPASRANTTNSDNSLLQGAQALSVEEGEASYYGDQFEGRLTANGETFRQNELTAAHRTYPFGTMLRVINLRNGQSVIVRVNDRGPLKAGRIIDLSRRAAEELDMIAHGIIPVRVEVLRWGG